MMGSVKGVLPVVNKKEQLYGYSCSFSKMCSNFFVFQSYELRFSEIFCLVLKRSFPGFFEKTNEIWGTPTGTILRSNLTES